MEPKTDIFISYRRTDGRDIARTVQLALKSAKAGNVFFDFSTLRDGVFNEKIYKAIDDCRVFVLVLSPQSLTRCSTPGDWVAIEINRARQTGCTIIPLAVDSNYDSWPADLPESLQFLKSIQQTKLLTDEYFEDSISRLLKRIESAPAKSTPTFKAPATSEGNSAIDTMMEALAMNLEACRLAMKKEDSRALSLFEKSAAMGLASSMANLGMIYENGKMGVERDYDKALQYYQEAASKNYHGGWLGVSQMYRQGIGVSGSREYLDDQAANCVKIAKEYRDDCEMKIDVSSMTPNSRLPVSENFQWILTDRQMNIIDRGTGNRLSSILRRVKNMSGTFFINGFDGTTYRMGHFNL